MSEMIGNKGIKKSGEKDECRTLAAEVCPHDGLANSARPLPVARNEHTIGSDAASRAESGCSAGLYAPQYAPLVCCPVGELRAHPSYARHKLSVDVSKLS